MPYKILDKQADIIKKSKKFTPDNAYILGDKN